MQHQPSRRAAATIALVSSACFLSAGGVAQASPDDRFGPDAAAVDVLEDVIDAVEDFDEALYDDALERATNGEVWLPDLVVDLVLDREVLDLEFWVDVLGDSDMGLYDWAAWMVDTERIAVGELSNGRGSIEERTWIDEEGAAILQVLDHRSLPVPPRARAALERIEPGDRPPDAFIYDSALRALQGIHASGDPAPAVAQQPPVEPVADQPVIQPVAEQVAVDATPSPSTAPPVEAAPSSSSNLLVGLALGVAVISMLVGIGAALRGRRHDKLADYAFTDSLTGLRNRRRMDADVAEQNELSARPTATLMIDVDHFKKFNDTYGHATGDEVLRMVGTALAQHFRKTDVPYRYGGEEFCVLLPETTEAEAMLAGERIRAAVEATELPVDQHITVSIGVSIGPASEISSTLQRADGALYAAKAGGRNRVALA